MVTHIVHADAALANLPLTCPVTQDKSLPVPTSDRAFDNGVLYVEESVGSVTE
jgi:hypothetical protein